MPVRVDAAVNGPVVTDERLWIFGGLLIARDTHNGVLEPGLIANMCTANSNSLVTSNIVLYVIFSFYNRSLPYVQPRLYNQKHGVRYPEKLIRAGSQLME